MQLLLCYKSVNAEFICVNVCMLVCVSMCLSMSVCARMCMHMDIYTVLHASVSLHNYTCMSALGSCVHTLLDAGVKQMTCHVCLPGSASSLVTNQNPITASILAY